MISHRLEEGYTEPLFKEIDAEGRLNHRKPASLREAGFSYIVVWPEGQIDLLAQETSKFVFKAANATTTVHQFSVATSPCWVRAWINVQYDGVAL